MAIDPAVVSLLSYVIVAVISVVGAGAFNVFIQRRKQPVDNANALAAVSQQSAAVSQQLIDLALKHVQTINDQNTDRTALVAQIAVFSAQSAEQTHNGGLKDQAIVELTKANVQLMADRDGMPTRIAELVKAALVRDGYILELEQSNADAGIPVKDRPVPPVQEPLTPLTEAGLLERLANEKSKRDADAQQVASDKTNGETGTPRS